MKRSFTTSAVLFFAAASFVPGCNSTDSAKQEDQSIQQLQNEMAARDSAEYHIPKARSFVLEQFPQLDEKASNYIMETQPTILTSSDGMLMLFYWKSPDWERGIQVVASPAPIGTPIAANIVDRPRFP